jgi:hypothetical protein
MATTDAGPDGLRGYLQDPFLRLLYREVRQAGPIRSISLDVTRDCNLRCSGCYFFSEGMDDVAEPKDDSALDALILLEKERGTNLVTVVGGEPSLVPERLRKLRRHFRVSIASNGLRAIPREGLEDMPIGISVWGDTAVDRDLRGGGKIDVFERALRNYRDDPRAFWYYTVTAGGAPEVERVVERCVANGNAVLFNFYGDLAGLGGGLDHRLGFAEVRRQISRMIDRFPERIMLTRYLSHVVTTGRLYDEEWGYAVCTNITPGNEINRDRVANGKPFNPHFRAYNADFATTRRCCTGRNRECSSCFDVWERFSWVMLNMRKHLPSKQEFTNWLTTMYLFYFLNRLVDCRKGIDWLPEIHRRAGSPYTHE